MADNIALSNVAGTPSVATRDVSSVHYQQVELHARAATATRTQVSDTASDTLLLAANTARLGCVITNDSSARLYVGLGTTTVTATNYSSYLEQGESWEMPPCYFTGQIRGIWATDPGDGGARVTELT